MKKKRRTRYSDEASILNAIDRQKANAKDCLNSAVALDETRKAHYRKIHFLELSMAGKKTSERELIESDIRALQHGCESLKHQASVLSRRRNRIENTLLPKLSVALAQFRTEIMEPITNDRSVLV